MSRETVAPSPEPIKLDTIPKVKPGPKMLPKHTRLICRHYERLGSTRAVAAHLRCSRGMVLRHLRAAGVEMRPAGRPSRST